MMMMVNENLDGIVGEDGEHEGKKLRVVGYKMSV